MAIYKITYSDEYKRATLHNWGCNMHCQGCSYKVLNYPKPESFPTMDKIKETLKTLDLKCVHFMGGEPTTNSQLPELLRFCKEELKVITRLGHTNGSRLPEKNLDATNVSIKAFDEDLYVKYTGHSGKPIFDNFVQAYKKGLEVKASVTFIPEFIGEDQVLKIAEFLAKLDPKIPMHIAGYIPVPTLPWRRPTDAEMKNVVKLAKQYLSTVTFSHLTPEQVLNHASHDSRFITRRIL
jgi:pyruvate formate lyase activating enzyme